MLPQSHSTPAFISAEAAWFWACAVLRDRHRGRAGPAGPCRVEDVIKGLDSLYRHRRIELLHARVLRHWGWRGRAPNPAVPRERCDGRLWTEAIRMLDYPLRQRGIVAGGPLSRGRDLAVVPGLAIGGDAVAAIITLGR